MMELKIKTKRLLLVFTMILVRATIQMETTSPSTIQKVEKTLLYALGMKRKPVIDKRKAHIPEALLNLYKLQSNNEYESTALPLPGKLTRSANIVRSYTHQESEIDARFPHNHKFRLFFNLTDFPQNEALISAELRLTIVPKENRSSNSIGCTDPHVHVYDIIQPGIKGLSQPILRKTETTRVRVTSPEETSISLDVLPIIERWLSNRSHNQNHGLLVKVASLTGEKCSSHVRLRRSTTTTTKTTTNTAATTITNTTTSSSNSNSTIATARTTVDGHIDDVQLYNNNNDNRNGSNNSSNDENDDDDNDNNNNNNNKNHNSRTNDDDNDDVLHDTRWSRVQPLLFLYTEDQATSGAQRRQRQPTDLVELERRKRSSPSQSRSQSRKRQHKECRRYPLQIRFKDVGWDDWIVAPSDYHAYYCAGECPTQMGDHLNTTNHAVVQALINSVYPNTIPRPCCVPTTLSSISMLYLNENSKAVLKNYDSMVVEGCGCR